MNTNTENRPLCTPCVDVLPAGIELAAMEQNLVSAISRETILRQVLKEIGKPYNYILIDCTPSLGLLTLNTLAAADNIRLSLTLKQIIMS